MKHEEGVENESVRKIGMAEQIAQCLFREGQLSLMLLTHSNCAIPL